MLKDIALSMLLCCGALAAESFEELPVGALASADTEYGVLTAAAGHAEILAEHARSGKQALHIKGGDKREVQLAFASPPGADTALSFWLERWTKRNPFQFELIAETLSGSVTLAKIGNMSVGRYKQQVNAVVPRGAHSVVLRCTSHKQGGVLVDDLLLDNEEMKLSAVKELPRGAYPMLKRAPINPVMGYELSTSGSLAPCQVQQLRLRVHPAAAVQEITLRSGNAEGTDFRNSVVFGKAKPAADGSVVVTCNETLKPGVNHLWVDATPSAESTVGATVRFEAVGMRVGDNEVALPAEPVSQSIGYFVAYPDEPVGNQPNGAAPRKCVSFRIPGLIRTASGALVGCFDARYLHSADLCADIDVAVVRSEDGGQTWTAPAVGMDAGPGANNGCGDPCILQDAENGRIWMQALACHFSGGASLRTSQTGFDPATTGQWEMVYSDDDGKTWSKNHINPTRQIKKEQWTTILAGPGNGIYTSDGIIVFPAQIWDRAATPRCMSTICYSTDHGKTWHYGNGVPQASSECQVVELQDGAIMINCRNEARQGNRVVYVTRDLGKTWQAHSTNNKALKEPTCQASLIAVNSQKYGKLLIFSNPKANKRKNMTLRVSADDGATWSRGYEYDSRECWGYSCVAMIDDDHVGVFYEAPHVNEHSVMHGIGFLRIPLKTIMEE